MTRAAAGFADQTWGPLGRRFRLLLVLTSRSDGARWVDGDRLIAELAEAYASPLSSEQLGQQWSSDAPLRKRARKMLHDDVDLLRPLGFSIEEQPTEPGAQPGGTTAAKSNTTYRFRLEPAPLVPVPLTAQNVQRVVQLVAAQRASRVDVPASALVFSRALQAGTQVRCASGEHVVEGDPLHLILRNNNRWIGLVRQTPDQRVLTLRLGRRGYHVEVLTEPVSPVVPVDPRRALDPLTWGSDPGETLSIRVTAQATVRALDVLGPAVQDRRAAGPDEHALDLWVTDSRLLLARLTSLRTTVRLEDPKWRQRLRDHLASLLTPAPWLPRDTARFSHVEADEPIDESLVQWSSRAPELRAMVKPHGRGPDLVGLTLLALALLDDRRTWSAHDLAVRLKTDVGTLQKALVTYSAAETDVLDTLPSVAAHVAPLSLSFDEAGRLLSVQQPDGSNRVPFLGRPSVSPEVVLAACVVAAEQVANPTTPSEHVADLAAFVSAAQEAVGLRFTTEHSAAGPATAGRSAALAVSRERIEQALEHTTSGEYRRASLNRPLADGLAVGGRPLHALTYSDPWTAEESQRLCVLLALRDHGPLRLLDVLDVDRVGLGPHPAPAGVRDPAAPVVRTLVADQVRHLEPLGGQRYPLSDAELEQLARSAAETVLARIAVRPGSGTGPLATLRRGWRGRLLSEQPSGQHVADVTLHPPAAERCLDLLSTWPEDLRILSPPWLASAVQRGVRELLAHHAAPATQ
jgi:hypothetical protein